MYLILFYFYIDSNDNVPKCSSCQIFSKCNLILPRFFFFVDFPPKWKQSVIDEYFPNEHCISPSVTD